MEEEEKSDMVPGSNVSGETRQNNQEESSGGGEMAGKAGGLQ